VTLLKLKMKFIMSLDKFQMSKCYLKDHVIVFQYKLIFLIS